MARQTPLIDGLKTALEANGQKVTLRETHISWILLAGDRAWKIKKEVNFGFLDFSTLAKRKYACEEELRLNSRFAPEIYLDVVSICGTPANPVPGGNTEPIEYAVRMLRFDESGLLSALADTQQLHESHIDAIARQVAIIHLQAPVAGSTITWGKARQVQHWLSESLAHIKRLVSEPAEARRVDKIDQLCSALYTQSHSAIEARSEGGFVRECHGDLHLGNMVWIKQQLVPFDCIEFNPALRWIDVISEAAFVMMDLQDRNYPAFSWRFINHYLSLTGDYGGLKVLRYYLVYRALVRAKVALLQLSKCETAQTKNTLFYAQYKEYASLAEHCLTQLRPTLILMHGLSASGKSTIASKIAEQYGCIHIRSDVERKRLHGLGSLMSSHSETDAGIYISSANAETYSHLYDLAAIVLHEGYPLIVDAAFLDRKQRSRFNQLAIDSKCPFLIVHCEAQHKILESRIIARAQKGSDPSEATLAVLQKQIERQDILTNEEPYITISDVGTLALPVEIKKHLRAGSR